MLLLSLLVFEALVPWARSVHRWCLVPCGNEAMSTDHTWLEMTFWLYSYLDGGKDDAPPLITDWKTGAQRYPANARTCQGGSM
jgi:hypothetical protein